MNYQVFASYGYVGVFKTIYVGTKKECMNELKRIAKKYDYKVIEKHDLWLATNDGVSYEVCELDYQ